ncbi:MAG: hypothetical protein M3217_03130, partial [Actinomycetota bacterium]|nr:hypothetical protein [Actinomycetota bacterium]
TRLRLGGTTTWSGGVWNVGGGALQGGTIENEGTLSVTGNVTAQDLGGGRLRNLASAQITRASSTGTATINPPLDNDGQLSAQTGELRLYGGTGPGERSSGAFSAAANATLAFAGQHEIGGAGSSLGGAGTARFDGSTTELAADAAYNPATTSASSGFVSLAGSGTTGRIISDGVFEGGRGGPGTLAVTGAEPSNFNVITFEGGGRTEWTNPAATTAATGTLRVRDQGTVLRLGGTTTWSGGSWHIGGGAPQGGTVENQGTLNVSGNVTAFNEQSTGRIHNLGGASPGRINRTTSTGAATLDPPLDNDGQVSAQTGELRMEGGTGSGETSSGSFSAAAGATLAFAGLHEIGGPGSSIGGAGTARFDGLLFGLPSKTSLANETTYSPGTTLASGSFVSLAGSGTTGRITSDGQGGGRDGAGTLSVGSGASSFDNITFEGGGATEFTDPAGSTTATGTLNVRGQNTRLRLGGTTTWSAGTWNVGGGTPQGGTLENQGTLNVTGNVSVANQQSSGRVHNLASAQINRTTSSGSATINPPLDNDGQVGAQTGELRLLAGTGSGETSSGSFSAAAGATLAFDGQHEIGGAGSSIGGAGTAEFEGSTTSLAADAAYSPGTTSVPEGFVSLEGSGTTGRIVSDGIFAGGRTGPGTLTVNGAGASTLNAVTFEGGGTTEWTNPASTSAAIGTVNVHELGTVVRLGGTSTWSGGAWNVGGGAPQGGTVENQGTLNVTGNVTAGDPGEGRMTNLSSGTLERRTSTGTATINVPLSSAGTLKASTGRLNVSSLTQTGGVSEVAGGAILDPTGGPMAVQGGTLKGGGTVEGSVSSSGGTVAPGASPGMLKITGNYEQGAGGTLKSEIEGTAVGTQYDQLEVTGSATLGGTLDIVNGSGHSPTPGDTFKIVKTANPSGRNGTFSSVIGKEIASNRRYVVGYDPDGVTLGVEQDPAPEVSIGDVTVDEGDSGTRAATFTVTRTSTSGGDMTVDFATDDGTATAPADYAAKSDSVTFTGTETSKQVTVDVKGDTVDESDENFTVNILNAQNATIADGEGSATIADDDPAPEVSIDDVSVTEEDSGTDPATFTVTRSPASGRSTTVDFATENGSATEPEDYASKRGSVTFAAGETSKQVTIDVKGDTLDEPDEDFRVKLSNPQHATLADAQGIGTINDDDPAPPPPEVSIDDVTAGEGDSGTAAATFTLIRNSAAGGDTTVDFATANGSATEPGDYAAKSGSVTFSGSETSKHVTVDVKGDTLDERNETFSVGLSSPLNATIADGQGAGTINDDDPAPRLSISDVSVREGNSGVRSAIFRVSLSAPSGLEVSTSYRSRNNTARAGSDFAAEAGTLRFSPGETLKTVRVVIAGDRTRERNERFFLDLAQPQEASKGDGRGQGTIRNDD